MIYQLLPVGYTLLTGMVGFGFTSTTSSHLTKEEPLKVTRIPRSYSESVFREVILKRWVATTDTFSRDHFLAIQKTDKTDFGSPKSNFYD